MNFVAENALDGALEELQRQATIIIFSNYLKIMEKLQLIIKIRHHLL